MPYKISGSANDDFNIIVLEEDGTVDIQQTVSSGIYEVDTTTSGSKIIIARAASGESYGFYGVSSYFAEIPTNFFLAGNILGATDDTGQHATTINGATVVSDPAGVGDDVIYLRGNGDYIYVPDSTDWNGEGGDYSVGWEAYWPSFSLGYIGIMTWGGYIGSNRKGTCFVWDGSGFHVRDLGVESPGLSKNGEPPFNTWVKYIVTFDSSAGRWKYYINDSLAAQSASGKTLGFKTNGLGFHIGRFYNDYAGYNPKVYFRNIWVKKGALITSGTPGA